MTSNKARTREWATQRQYEQQHDLALLMERKRLFREACKERARQYRSELVHQARFLANADPARNTGSGTEAECDSQLASLQQAAREHFKLFLKQLQQLNRDDRPQISEMGDRLTVFVPPTLTAFGQDRNNATELELDMEAVTLTDQETQDLLELINIDCVDQIRRQEQVISESLCQKPVLTCPVCDSNPLLFHKPSFFCACGLRINTELDGIDISYVASQLYSADDDHRRSGCCAALLYHEKLGILWAACSVCCFHQVVI